MTRTVLAAGVLCAATVLAYPAYAKSSVTVDNGWTKAVEAAVFDGKESTCQWRDASKKATIEPGASTVLSCSGESKDRCRVTIRLADTDTTFCKDIYKNCKGRAATVEDGGKVVLSGTGEAPTCTTVGKSSGQ